MASLPSRATKMYLALGLNSIVSIGAWVLMKRRCGWASSAGMITSAGTTRRSSQGDSMLTCVSSAPLKMSCETICCVQVVPDLPQLAMTMSSGRKGKSFHLVVSRWLFCSSQVFTGCCESSIWVAMSFGIGGASASRSKWLMIVGLTGSSRVRRIHLIDWISYSMQATLT